MSLYKKVKKLEGINDVIGRCSNNTGIYDSLVKEKQKLERDIYNMKIALHEIKNSHRGVNAQSSDISYWDRREKRKSPLKQPGSMQRQQGKEERYQPRYINNNEVKNRTQMTTGEPNKNTNVHRTTRREEEQYRKTEREHVKTKQSKGRRPRTRQSEDSTETKVTSTDQSRSTKSISSSYTEGSKPIKQFTKEEIEQMATHYKKKHAAVTHAKQGRYQTAKLEEQTYNAPKWRQVNTFLAKKMNGQEHAAPAQGNSRIKSPTKMTSRLMQLREEEKETKENTRGSRYQKFSPVTESMGKEAVLANSHKLNLHKNQRSVNSDRQLRDGTKLLKGEVVFKFGKEELKKPPEKKSLTKMLRKKLRKPKTPSTMNANTQTHREMYSQALQVYSWKLPGHLRNTSTQTTSHGVSSRSSQTPATVSKERTTQTRRKTKTVQTQYQHKDAQTKEEYTQTEDEDDPIWGGRVSLDRLIRCREERRKRLEDHSKVDDELQKNIKEIVLPFTSDKQTSTGSAPIRAYSWSQTEKFVKVVVSHSGLHLFPKEQIQVKTNGLNLQLQINEDKEAKASNSNNSNNNNNEKSKARNLYELKLDKLCHPIKHVSYAIQSDMMTLFLRKADEVSWDKLAIETDFIAEPTTAKVYV